MQSVMARVPSAPSAGKRNALRAAAVALWAAGTVACQPSSPAAAPDEAAPSEAAAQSAEAAPADQHAAAQHAAIEDAEEWLQLIDQGQYAESWQEAAAIFQSSTTQEQWKGAVESVRSPLGDLTSRKVVGSQFRESLPGAPDGKYVVIQYDSAFAQKGQAKEIVTTAQAPDGSWRVAGYFIE